MKTLRSGNPIFFDNTEAEHIIITPTKLDNSLRDLGESEKYLGLAIGSIGIFLTVLATLITADFQNKFDIPAAGWQGAFVILCAGSFIATIIFIYKYKKASHFDRKKLIEILTDKKYYGFKNSASARTK